MVVCSPGGFDAPMVAFDKRTGSVIWKAQIPQGDDAGYASAIVVNTDGKKQIVQFLAKGLVGVDAANGKMLWRYDGTGSGPANMATPVAREIYIYSPGQAGSAVVKLTAANGDVQAEELYRVRGLPNAIGGAVLVDGYLYGTERSDGLVCADFLTGEVKWKTPSVGMGAVCSADGLLYVYGESGELALVEASPQGYREKGRFTPPDRPQHANDMEKTWSSPVVANGRLYVRDKSSLWCYDVSETAAGVR
jgi:outer membrane protein assembly factor BamB